MGGDWSPVRLERGGETPPALVGATLSCLEVPLQAYGLVASKDNTGISADDIAGIDVADQYGLFLFGGDDEESRQTDTLLVYMLHERKWRKPLARGRSPSKRSRHTASVVLGPNSHKQLLIFGGVGATNAISILEAAAVHFASEARKVVGGAHVVSGARIVNGATKKSI